MELPSPAFFISEEQLVEYLNHSERRLSNANIELAVSVWTCRVFRNKYKKPYFIGFQIEDELHRLVPGFDGTNIDHIQEVLTKHLRKDTVIDFAIVRAPLNGHRNSGHAFQIKRVGRNIKTNYLAHLADEINTICEKFKAGETGLIIIPEIGPFIRKKEIDAISRKRDVAPLARSIRVPKDSFKVVWILNRTFNEVWISQIYPTVDTFGGFRTIMNPYE